MNTTDVTMKKTGKYIALLLTIIFMFSCFTVSPIGQNTVYAASTITIRQQPKDVVVPEGTDAVFTVIAEGNGLTYTWYYKNPSMSSFSKSTNTTNSFSTTMTAARNGRQSYCIIKDASGNSVQTNTVTMTLGTPQQALKITKQPVDAVAAVGENAVFTIEAEGEGLTYTWYYKNADKTSFTKSTSTKATYTTAMTADRDGRQIYCIVKDASGNTVQSNTVTMKLPALNVLKITKQPVDAIAAVGENAVFTIEAEGEGLTYTWYYKNADKTTFTKSTSTKATYTTAMTADRDGRQIYCVVKDASGNTVQSNTVTMKLPAVKVLKITKQPVDAIAAIGESAVFTVEAEGEGLTYTWYYKNADKTTFTKSTVTKPTYTTAMQADRDGRQIYCIVKDASGNTVQSNTVTMKLPAIKELKITKQPVDAVAAVGENAVFTVEAEGEGLTYTWYYKNADKTAFTKSTATKATYTTAMTADRDGRQVYCIVKDSSGKTVQTNTVTMKLPNLLKITKQPEDVTAEDGANVTFTIAAEGDGVTYTWYYKNPGSSSFSKSTNTTDTFTTTMTSARNGRQMYCVVKDKNGNSLTSRTATMTLFVPAVITIKTQPVASVSARLGETFSFSLAAEIKGGDGTEVLTYQWQMQESNGSWSNIPGAVKASFSQQATESNVNTKYRCVVGAIGTGVTSVTSNTVTVNLAEPPRTELKITEEPEDVTVEEGTDVVFHVAAEGDGLTYSWYYKNPGSSSFSKSTNATDTFSIAMTAARNGRQMYCVVKDKYGNSLTSRTATMTMIEPAVISIIAQPQKSITATLGQNCSFTVAAEISGGTGSEMLLYQWQKKEADGSWVEITGATNATLNLQASSYNVNTMYRCVIDATGTGVQTVISDTAILLQSSEWETEIL